MLIWNCCLLLASIVVQKNVKITFYVKAGKRYADRGWDLCNEAEWCLCLTHDSKYFNW